MEAKLDEKAHHFYGPVVSDLKALGKRSMKWDLNDWKWDGALFTDAPLNSVPSDCRSRQFFPVGSEIPTNTRTPNSFSSGSDEMISKIDKGKRELEKRRTVVDVEDEDMLLSKYLQTTRKVRPTQGSAMAKRGSFLFLTTYLEESEDGVCHGCK